MAAIAREGGADIPLTGWSFDGIGQVDLRQSSDASNAYGTWWANISSHVNRYRVTYSHGEDVSPDAPADVTAQAVARVFDHGGVAAEGTVQQTMGQFTQQFQQAQGAPGKSPWLTRAERNELRDAGYRRRASTITTRLL